MRKIDVLHKDFSSNFIRNEIEFALESFKEDLTNDNIKALEFISTDASTLYDQLNYVQIHKLEEFYPLFKEKKTWYLKVAAYADAAYFIQAAVSEPVEVDLYFEKRKVEPSFIKAGIGAYAWIMGFFKAMLLRDRKLIDIYLAISEELFYRDKYGQDEFQIWYSRFFRDLYLEPKRAYDTLFQAYDKTAPEYIKYKDIQGVLNTDALQMEMFFALFKRESQAFNDSLFKALEGYKFNLQKSPKTISVVSYEITAIAGLAYDFGIPIEVECEYMPRHLVECKLDV